MRYIILAILLSAGCGGTDHRDMRTTSDRGDSGNGSVPSGHVEIKLNLSGGSRGLALSAQNDFTNYIVGVWCKGGEKYTSSKGSPVSIPLNGVECAVFFDSITTNGRTYQPNPTITSYDQVKNHRTNNSQFRLYPENYTAGRDPYGYVYLTQALPERPPYSDDLSVEFRFTMHISGTQSDATFSRATNLDTEIRGQNYPRYLTLSNSLIKSEFDIDKTYREGYCPMQVKWECDGEADQTDGKLHTCEGQSFEDFDIEMYQPNNIQKSTFAGAQEETDPEKVHVRLGNDYFIVRLPLKCTQTTGTEEIEFSVLLSNSDSSVRSYLRTVITHDDAGLVSTVEEGTGRTVSDGDPDFANVVLLLQDSLTDESPQGQTLTIAGDTAISTAESKFGGSSISFDGSGDWLTAAADPSLVFGTSPFTVEFWMYWDGTVTGTPYMGVMGAHNAFSTGRYGIFMTANGIGHYIQSQFPAMSAVPANQWVHIASTRDSSGTCRFFIDGALKTTVTDTGNLTAPQGFRVGNDLSTGRPPFSGYIDSLRITTGHARYTANFTPPATCVPNSSQSQSCSGSNGSGTQSRTCNSEGSAWGAYGACEVTSCNSGYYLHDNRCLQNPSCSLAVSRTGSTCSVTLTSTGGTAADGAISRVAPGESAWEHTTLVGPLTDSRTLSLSCPQGATSFGGMVRDYNAQAITCSVPAGGIHSEVYCNPGFILSGTQCIAEEPIRMCTMIAGYLFNPDTQECVFFSNGCQRADLIAAGMVSPPVGHQCQ